MNTAQELASLLHRNLPYLVREEATVLRLLGDADNTVFSRRNEHGALIAAAVVHKDAIYLLCVDADYRNQGIGSALLEQAEAAVRNSGYAAVTVGAGEDYLMPGVPTDVMPYPEALYSENLPAEANDAAVQFFAKRGYVHAWGACNCFDMRLALRDLPDEGLTVGSECAGVRYRWATPCDADAVCACTDDAHPPFTQYYRNPALYDGSSTQRVLLAERDEQVLGVLIVSQETEGRHRGSVGCTAVRHAWRGKHIAANLVRIGTHQLKACGLDEGFLGYTYSGLDKLYGLAGYHICLYYFMAQKTLAPTYTKEIIH